MEKTRAGCNTITDTAIMARIWQRVSKTNELKYRGTDDTSEYSCDRLTTGECGRDLGKRQRQL